MTLRIAIVDDDPIVCSSLATILGLDGSIAVAWTATGGAEALDRWRADAPDILLLDIQMPGVDGLAVARTVLGEEPSARVLFLTTFADRAYISEALALGARGYLVKQDVSSVEPALRAVMAGQIVLGAPAVGVLSQAGAATGAESASSPADGVLAALSPRERSIVELVAQGLDNHQIAEQLFLSEGTVRNRVSEILAKTGAGNRTRLAVLWLSHSRGDR